MKKQRIKERINWKIKILKRERKKSKRKYKQMDTQTDV